MEGTWVQGTSVRPPSHCLYTVCWSRKLRGEQGALICIDHAYPRLSAVDFSPWPHPHRAHRTSAL